MKHLSVQILSSYQLQNKIFEGRVHLVVPVVLLKEGVHNGSGGPMFYPAEELSSFTGAWNGIPVPIYHPVSTDGSPISCNSPEVIEENNIGRLFNVIFVDGKLKGEIWIDEIKARQIAPEVLSALLAGKILEVSTGLFSDDESTAGVWNGEAYEGIVRNIRPDHLAILPGQTGACSVADGCGIRANKGGIVETKSAILEFISNSRRGKSFEDRRHMLQKEMDKKDVRPSYNMEGAISNSYVLHYVISTFPNYFIVAKETNEGSKLYKCNYTINGEMCIIEDNMIEVKEETNYVEITANAEVIKNDKKEETNMKCCPEKVQALIDNATNGFMITDKEWLLDLSSEAFDRIVANSSTNASESKIEEELKKAETVEEVVANATAEMKAKVEAGIKMFEEKKATFVKDILANDKNKFSKEELEAMTLDGLDKIFAFAHVADFSGQGSAPITTNAVESEILTLPTINIEKK